MGTATAWCANNRPDFSVVHVDEPSERPPQALGKSAEVLQLGFDFELMDPYCRDVEREGARGEEDERLFAENGGARVDHGGGGMVQPRRRKTLPVRPFPATVRVEGFTPWSAPSVLSN